MKRFTIVCTVIGTIFFLIGIGITAGAAVLGADTDEWFPYTNRYHSSTERVRTASDSIVYDTNEIRALEIKSKSAHVSINAVPEAEAVSVEMSEGSAEVRCYLDSRTLVIEEVRNNGQEAAQVTITMPQSMNLEEVDIKAASGSVTASGMSTRELDLEIISGFAEFYSLTVNGDVKISCLSGNVTAELNADQSDYNYEMKCMSGSITAGDYTAYSFSGNREIDQYAPYDMELECLSGSISAVFLGNQ